MSTIGVLIFFSIVGAFICSRSRSAGGAIFFAGLAVVLFVTTPLGSGLPGALSTFINAVSHSSGPILDGTTSRAGAG